MLPRRQFARVFGTEEQEQEQDVARQTLRNLSEMMRRVDDSPEAKKDAALSRLRKNNPPIFMGGTHPSEAGRWLEDIEQLLDLSSTPGELRVEFATNCLREKARKWWIKTKAENPETPENPGPMLWPRFKALFEKNYYKPAYKRAKAAEFRALTQGTKSVAQYEAEFRELRCFIDLISNAEEARCFEQGLRSEISDRMINQIYDNLNEVIEAATNIEQKLVEARGRSSFSSSTSYRGQPSGQSSAVARPGWQGRLSGTGRGASSSGGTGSYSRGSPYFRSPSDGQSRGFTRGARLCFGCGQQGHIRQNCPYESSFFRSPPPQQQRPSPQQYRPSQQQFRPSSQPYRPPQQYQPLQYYQGSQQSYQGPPKLQLPYSSTQYSDASSSRPSTSGQGRGQPGRGRGRGAGAQPRVFSLTPTDTGASNEVVEGDN